MSDTPFEVVKIKTIESHPNADRLEIIKVLNTQFVAQKSQYQPGELCVYLPPDMLINEYWAQLFGVVNYLKHSIFPGDLQKSRCRIGAVRLRGVASFGFGISLNEFETILHGTVASVDLVEGTDVTKYLDGVRYKLPDQFQHRINAMRQPAVFHTYTNIQHYYRNADAIPVGIPVRITEKIHGCMVSWQPITMADGSRKKISQIVAGDEVLGVDKGGQIVTSTVTETFKNGHAEKWLRIQTTRRNADKGPSFCSVKCTPEHKFFSPENDEYAPAGSLKVGQEVLIHHLNHVDWLPEKDSEYKPTLCMQTITAIEDITDKTQSQRYDIETTTHNYFAGSVLVHNSNSRVGLVVDNGFEFMVGTHHRRVQSESDSGRLSLYWTPLTENMKDMLAYISRTHDNVIVFGEIYGHKIQTMDYGCERGKGYRVFDISVNSKYLDWLDVCGYCELFELETVPLLYKGPFYPEVIDGCVDGPTMLAEPGQIKCSFKGREGIVITPLEEQFYDGGRLILKAVSADYYEKVK